MGELPRCLSLSGCQGPKAASLGQLSRDTFLGGPRTGDGVFHSCLWSSWVWQTRSPLLGLSCISGSESPAAAHTACLRCRGPGTLSRGRAVLRTPGSPPLLSLGWLSPVLRSLDSPPQQLLWPGGPRAQVARPESGVAGRPPPASGSALFPSSLTDLGAGLGGS